MSNKKPLHFEVSANLQRLIGEELISNEEMAFIELVKNAYDSGASKVHITLHQETPAAYPYVTIFDDGEGMDLDDFQSRFMFAAYSERDQEAATATRIPTGEKGIGRFAADRIGTQLTVTTKSAQSQKALEVSFDWTEFRDKSKKFNEIDIPYSYVENPFGASPRGTLLTIRNLRSKWDRTKVEDLKIALGSLLSPYKASDGFRIEVSVVGRRPSTERITPQKPIQANYVLQFKVTHDGRVLRKFRSPADGNLQDWTPVPGLLATSLPNLKGILLYYIRKPSKTLVKGLLPGVQLFRDGFLMQPFGSPISDRLELIEKRVKRAGHATVVPNRLFGFVDISRLLHPGLRDTTSRQEMIDTQELHELVIVLKSQTNFLEENILEQVKKPSWRKAAQQQAILVEQARLNSLGNLSVGIGHEIRQPLQSILSEVDAMEIRLAELDVKDAEIADSLQTVTDAAERIDTTITFIKQLASGDLEDLASFDIAETVRRECKLFEAQNDDITFDVQTPKEQQATTNQTTVMHTLANLLRNSVEAIREVQDERQGSISILLTREGSKHVLKVADNGVGIAEDIRPKIFKKFATQKRGGLGFGLTYCHTILEALGGRITFVSEVGAGTTFRVEIPQAGGI
jgi:signal transduction histidine kinase